MITAEAAEAIPRAAVLGLGIAAPSWCRLAVAESAIPLRLNGKSRH
jgi:hypothetical protein